MLHNVIRDFKIKNITSQKIKVNASILTVFCSVFCSLFYSFLFLYYCVPSLRCYHCVLLRAILFWEIDRIMISLSHDDLPSFSLFGNRCKFGQQENVNQFLGGARQAVHWPISRTEGVVSATPGFLTSLPPGGATSCFLNRCVDWQTYSCNQSLAITVLDKSLTSWLFWLKETWYK